MNQDNTITSEKIRLSLDQPDQLENLYRANKASFRKAFFEGLPQLGEHPAVAFWKERLRPSVSEISWGSRQEILFWAGAVALAGLIAKIPSWTHLIPEYFYSRNAGYIFLPLLTGYFAWKNKISAPGLWGILGAFAGTALFINLIPAIETSDTFVLACLHLPLFLWTVLGYSYTGSLTGNYPQRLGFLRFNGDWLIITTLLLLAGAVTIGLTFSLFSLIGISINAFVTQYVLVWGLPAAPLIGTYLIQANPNLVRQVSPIIARLFTPLVLITLMIYLPAMVIQGKDPYNDREFLLVFNGLLAGVMALIFFSLVAISSKPEALTGRWILLLLALVSLAINGIAVSAIVFRILELGATPNRMAILGDNLLMLVHLGLVTWGLIQSLTSKNLEAAGNRLVGFLPAYAVWALVVVVLFPFVFGFK